jgi:hypothetical protein
VATYFKPQCHQKNPQKLLLKINKFYYFINNKITNTNLIYDTTYKDQTADFSKEHITNMIAIL